jgi:zinc finger protein
MLTRIPFYKDVIISSFCCDHCNYKNSEIESANTIKEKGISINLLVKSKSDLNREIIKSDFATLEIPEVDFEIPARTQKSCKLSFYFN